MAEETPFAGLFVKKADPEVLKDLDARGLLYDAPKFEHSYPHCWRCDTPLIYYARESWFIKMTAVKEDLIANNNTINWIPESIGKGRFGDWLENVQDWGISRNRYWGTPLNIWECECGHMHSVGSIEELKEMSDNCPDDIELHRPYIDAVTIKCPKCGKEMHRVPEVIDCWFDSGSMPFAQHHYPFENKDVFEKQFPAQFISEAVDQTRGWFYSLLAISTLLFNKAPYENVIVLGLVQDENGQKMSKSKGNAVDPFDALQTYGADAIRWYFYTSSAPWLPSRFAGKTVVEGQRKFMGTLWNTYAFFVLYANIDNFDATKYSLEYEKLAVMDKWLLSRLESTVKAVDDNLENYRIPEAAKALQSFVDDMSNWYVRRSRERFWAKGMEQDKINAYMTLYTALVTVAKAAAPMIPFMTEDIYQNLVKSIDASAPESIHLCDFPEVHENWIDPKKVEFSIYSVIENHFLAKLPDGGEPIITDVTKVVQTLNSVCVEMDTRYDLLKMAHVRNIKEYNEKFINRRLNPEKGHKFMPYIVVVIDEFGDLIMTAGKEVELPIARIAQLARAVGIHMIIATQRPTTNIITGTIKANFPARIAFRVSAMMDSRTILDRPGANRLIGKGDMLFLQGADPVRVQCAFIDTPEVEEITKFIARQQSYPTPFFLPEFVSEDGGSEVGDIDMGRLDPLFEDAARLVVIHQQGSTSLIQRKFAIGYNRAGRIMDQLEKAGIVGPTQGSKARDVLCMDDNDLEMRLNNLQ